LLRLGHDLNSAAAKLAAIYNIDPDEVLRKGRRKPRVDAKKLLCYWAARELKMPLTDLARQLDMTVSGVGYAVQRGESIALRYNYRLLE
jgi:putative transposase